jgi:hypothetical protein
MLQPLLSSSPLAAVFIPLLFPHICSCVFTPLHLIPKQNRLFPPM